MYISEIHVYPVKSLAGVSLDAAQLNGAGFEFDRQWMVTRPDGSFMTQRNCPQMALVETSVDNGRLTLSSFGMEPHTVAPVEKGGNKRINTQVWEDPVQALEHDAQTSEWLSQALGVDCRLVSFPYDEIRPCDPELSKAGEHTRFADAFPLLLLSQGSLDDLNTRLENPVGMDRFRPNIVVGGCEPLAEDNWKKITVGEVRLRVTTACARCSVPTIDQQTGVSSGPEPIHTLSGYRRREDGEVYFGINLAPETTGVVRTGDPVSILD